MSMHGPPVVVSPPVLIGSPVLPLVVVPLVSASLVLGSPVVGAPDSLLDPSPVIDVEVGVPVPLVPPPLVLPVPALINDVCVALTPVSARIPSSPHAPSAPTNTARTIRGFMIADLITPARPRSPREIEAPPRAPTTRQSPC